MSKRTFIVEKNFLSKEQCDFLIEHYKKNIHNSFQYRDTYPLNIDRIQSITDKIENICHSIDNSCILETQQIVKWPSGSYMDPHFDSVNDVFAVIVYLNDDYQGGETCFEKNCSIKQKITPETGKLLLFSNKDIIHWVNEVKNGIRYTLVLWYVRK
jgi:hypothetical protein